jgi:hypothetical protein
MKIVAVGSGLICTDAIAVSTRRHECGRWVVGSVEILLVTPSASNCISQEARKIQFVLTSGSLTPLFA